MKVKIEVQASGWNNPLVITGSLQKAYLKHTTGHSENIGREIVFLHRTKAGHPDWPYVPVSNSTSRPQTAEEKELEKEGAHWFFLGYSDTRTRFHLGTIFTDVFSAGISMRGVTFLVAFKFDGDTRKSDYPWTYGEAAKFLLHMKEELSAYMEAGNPLPKD